MIWNIISWIVVGGIAGWLASLIMKTDGSMGLVGNIIVGIVGALIGGFIMNLLGASGADESAWDLWSFLVSLVGAVVLLFIIRLFRRA